MLGKTLLWRQGKIRLEQGEIDLLGLHGCNTATLEEIGGTDWLPAVGTTLEGIDFVQAARPLSGPELGRWDRIPVLLKCG